MGKDNRGGFVGFCARCIRAAWRELISKPQTYAQIAAGPVNAAIVCWVIKIVAMPRWGQAHAQQQLEILMYLGILASVTNGIVVVALSKVNLSAHGPGQLSLDVGAGSPTGSVSATAQISVAQEKA